MVCVCKPIAIFFRRIVSTLGPKWLKMSKVASAKFFAAVLKPIFLDKKCDPRLGLLLPKPGAPSLKLYVDLQVVLQDKFCWSYKGDAALKPCLLRNVEYDTEAIDDDDMGGACFGHFLTYNSLRIYSSEEILQSYDRLKAKKHELSKACNQCLGRLGAIFGKMGVACPLPYEAFARSF